jgi:hypothetical protein
MSLHSDVRKKNVLGWLKNIWGGNCHIFLHFSPFFSDLGFVCVQKMGRME